MGLSHQAGRGAALRLWLRAPASLPADYINRPVKSKLLHVTGLGDPKKTKAFPGVRGFSRASIEDADLRAPRGLDRALFQRLAAGDWMGRHEGVLITGPTRLGKSWLACAWGQKACRDGRRVLYQRLPRLFEALALARGDGRHARMLKMLARVELLILDDWGLSGLTQAEREELLEILEDRHGRGSTIVTSQVPVEQWHEVMGSATLADAILDRLVHNAHRIELRGESMRKLNARRSPPAGALDPNARL
jgi:DNA replication protein DnaC